MTIEEKINSLSTPVKVVISTMTEVKLNKKDKTKELHNELPPVFKLSKVLVSIGENYEEKVNKVLVESGQEPTFKSEGLKWGTNIDNKWVEHNGTKYLKVIEINHLGQSNYVTKEENSVHLPIITYESFEPFLPAKKDRQDADHGVKFRMYKLDSIISIDPFEEE